MKHWLRNTVSAIVCAGLLSSGLPTVSFAVGTNITLELLPSETIEFIAFDSSSAQAVVSDKSGRFLGSDYSNQIVSTDAQNAYSTIISRFDNGPTSSVLIFESYWFDNIKGSEFQARADVVMGDITTAL